MDDESGVPNVREAGRRGGETTKARHGSAGFFGEIGRKGGAAIAAKRGPEHYKRMAERAVQIRMATPRMVTCVVCGTEFASRSPNRAIYCSPKCRWAASRQRRQGPT